MQRKIIFGTKFSVLIFKIKKITYVYSLRLLKVGIEDTEFWKMNLDKLTGILVNCQSIYCVLLNYQSRNLLQIIAKTLYTNPGKPIK